MAHPNEDLVRAGYAAFAKGDMEALGGLFAPDVVWHFPGHSLVSGDVGGLDNVLAWLGKNFELSGGTLKLDIHDVLASDDHAVALITVTAQREGKSHRDNSIQLFHVRDGKVKESWIYPSDQEATDEFWS